MSLITIIIVNYRTPQLTRRCVESIYSTSIGKACEVIIVDNDSKELFDENLENDFPALCVIRNPVNSGFGRANNLGLEKAKGEYILFLNSDMILKHDTLDICLTKIKSDNQIGVLSCLLFNEDGSEQRSRFYHVCDYKELLKMNLFLEKIFAFKDKELKAVIGAFMFLPKQVLDTVGGFDPDFFMYSEELELCLRVRKSGKMIYQTSETSAIHKHGGSTTDSLWSIRQKFVSNLLFYRKEKGVTGFFLYHILFCFNSITNFTLMWLLDVKYRRNYFREQKVYLYSFKYFITILFWGKAKQHNFLKVTI